MPTQRVNLLPHPHWCHSELTMVKTRQATNAQAMDTVSPPPPVATTTVKPKRPRANTELEKTINQPVKQAPRNSKKTVRAIVLVSFQLHPTLSLLHHSEASGYQ
jgi:hypothetical protein